MDIWALNMHEANSHNFINFRQILTKFSFLNTTAGMKRDRAKRPKICEKTDWNAWNVSLL